MLQRNELLLLNWAQLQLCWTVCTTITAMNFALHATGSKQLTWYPHVATVRMHWSVAAIHCSKFCRQTHTNRAQRLPACPVWRGSLPPFWVPRIVCGNSKLIWNQQEPEIFREIPTCLLKPLWGFWGFFRDFSVWTTKNAASCGLQVSCRGGASPCCWLGSPGSPVIQIVLIVYIFLSLFVYNYMYVITNLILI